MTETVARGGVEPTPRARGAGYSVMEECLRLQSGAAPRGKVATFFGRSPLHPDAASWFRGSLAEIEVGALLAKLGDGWTVLHAVPFGSAETDIDHVVIGPPGVFTINTKNHSGKSVWAAGKTFMINGQKERHIHASLSEGSKAAKSLIRASGMQVAVTPLIVVVRPKKLIRKDPAVRVLSSGELLRWLRKQPVTLSADEVERLSSVAEHRGTWHTVAQLTDDTLRQDQRFARLKQEVDAAQRRRNLWSFAFLGAALAAFTALVLQAPALISALFAALLS